MLEKTLDFLKETLGRNMDAQGGSGEASDGKRNIFLDIGGNVILIMKQQRICVLVFCGW